ncbi:MAG: hypothetical protein WAV32_06415 [Halobacteriota archaeon]
MRKERAKNILALVCVGMLCAVAVAMPTIIGIIEQEDFLALDIVTQTTTPGDNASYLITIKNIGHEPDTYYLIAINIDNASVASLSQSLITLDTGQSGTAVLNVTDELIPGPYCVLVNVTSHTTGLCDEVETVTAVIEEWEE